MGGTHIVLTTPFRNRLIARSAGYTFKVGDEPIVVDRRQSVVVISMSGDHDVFTAPELRTAVNKSIEKPEPVVIDLTDASFIDSSILAVLLGGLRRAREGGVGFALVLDADRSSPVRRILEVTGLVPVFPIHPELEEAVAAAEAGENGDSRAAE
jgi:anti-sigma B factor antagonist